MPSSIVEENKIVSEGKLTISIDPVLKRQLKQLAAKKGQTMGDVIADAITPVIQQELGV